jgi:hypothetical protein
MSKRRTPGRARAFFDQPSNVDFSHVFVVLDIRSELSTVAREQVSD